MNNETGEIKQFTQEDIERMKARDIAGGRRSQLRLKWVPLTDREAEFMSAKGIAFRQLWGTRKKKGFTREQKAAWDRHVEAFHATEEP